MTSHHDVAGVVAELRNGASVNGVGPRVANLAAEVLESQAKALSEAERDRDWLAKRLDLLAVGFGVPDGGRYIADWQSKIARYKSALAAEARLAEAMKVIEPFAKAGELFDPRDPDGYDQCIYGPAAGDEYSLKGDHLRAARAFTNAAKTQESKDA